MSDILDDHNDFGLQCPPPFHADQVQLDHGGGGQLSQQLLEQVIQPRFANAELARGHDSALLQFGDARVAFTTDSYVINPLIFPGGDIGKLAVYGTVNDLLMAGARPRYLSCSLIIEEGLPLETLTTILDSMAAAAKECEVAIVTGDTKVVDRGHGDGLYINTAGIGVREWPGTIAPQSIQPGDAIVLSAGVGRHGLAIMAQREGLQFDTPITSDCASLLPAVTTLLENGIDVHCMRDATRGGLASILVELAELSGLSMTLSATAIPVSEVVVGGCELLGLDPLYVANEGCFVAMVPEAQLQAALTLLRDQAVSRESVQIGRVDKKGEPKLTQGKGRVCLQTAIGSTRLLRRMTGRLLPRIC
ncbi:hydrogenase expression/formation protein HypE [Aestuariicella hydrocarbonica]|uniref:Hydrogenase expression/formation protein HypE n=1 Tax=Pseudomaricurvus hydrocarbonicus TaxID=1470433 RepID=A0A9E5T3P3_9GAMM|nr:hydrogenase expression/formation protein HypE [Aestuariicella hydrocarbonica]NHO67307.1 hydrogenase expression/formation protein HypE [Aestuariicella hydrocarbonica]